MMRAAMKRARVELAKLRCERCGWEWTPRLSDVRICPRCKSARWDEPRKTEPSKTEPSKTKTEPSKTEPSKTKKK